MTRDLFASCGCVCEKQTGRTRAGHRTEAGEVRVFVLKPNTAALVSQRRHRSWYSSVNKARVWCATRQPDRPVLLITTQQRAATVREEKSFDPDSAFSSAKPPTRGQSACGVCHDGQTQTQS